MKYIGTKPCDRIHAAVALDPRALCGGLATASFAVATSGGGGALGGVAETD